MAKKKVVKKKAGKSRVAKPKAEMRDRIKTEVRAEEAKESSEMPVLEALGKFKELRKYVSMEGKFRTGLTEKDLAEGQKMVKQLNIKM